MECCYKHALSIISEKGRLYLYPHNIYGKYSPYLTVALNSDAKKISEIIQRGIESGELKFVPNYSTPKCPYCGSLDPIVKISCPKCNSPNVTFFDGRFKCRNCGLEGEATEALTFMCKTCGNTFTLASSELVNLGYVESTVKDDYLEKVAKSLEEAGINFSRCAEVKGLSGYSHVFDFYFEIKGKKYAVNVFKDEEGVDVKEIMKSLVDAYDVKLDVLYVLAVPKLKVSLYPNVKNVEIIEGELEQGLEALKQNLEIIIKK